MPRRLLVWIAEVTLNVSFLRMWFSTAGVITMTSKPATIPFASARGIRTWLTTPMIAGMDAPHHLLLPRSTLAFLFDVVGAAPPAKGNYIVLATLEAENGAVRAEGRQDLADPHRIALPIPAAEPGACTLRLTLLDAAGKKCSESAQPVMMHAGPLY